MSKQEIRLTDNSCSYCGGNTGERNSPAYCEECMTEFCESCAVQGKYCPDCWDDDEDGPRRAR